MIRSTHTTATRQFTTGSHNGTVAIINIEILHIIKETRIIYTIPAAASNLGSDCSVFVIFLITLKVVFSKLKFLAIASNFWKA